MCREITYKQRVKESLSAAESYSKRKVKRHNAEIIPLMQSCVFVCSTIFQVMRFAPGLSPNCAELPINM
jgi:hypothetical protein